MSLPIPPEWNPKTLSAGLGGIEYVEHAREGAPTTGKISGTATAHAAVRQFITSWDDGPAFIRAVVGYVDIINDIPVTFPPQAFPGFPDILAKSFTLEGLGKPADEGEDESASYDYASIVITYDNAPIQRRLDPQELFAYTVDITSEVLQVEGPGFRWRDVGQPGADGEPVDFPIGIKVQLIDFSIRQPNILIRDFPFNYLLGFVGKMNSDFFQGISSYFCVYLGPSAQGAVLNTGVGVIDIIHRFHARSIPFTHAFRPGFGWRELEPWPLQTAVFGQIFNL